MAPSTTTWVIEQNFVDENIPPIKVKKLQLSGLTLTALRQYLPPPEVASPPCIGIAPGYTKTGKLSALIIVAGSNAVVMQMSGSSGGKNGEPSKGASILQEELFTNPSCAVLAFDLSPIALSLYNDHRLRLTVGIDIQSALPIGESRSVVEAIKYAVGDQAEIWEENINSSFNNFIFSDDRKTIMLLVSRAWCAYYMSTLPLMENMLYCAEKINTLDNHSDQRLDILAKQSNDIIRMENQKVMLQEHDTSTAWDSKQEDLDVKSNRFQNRMRGSGQTVRVETSTSLGTFSVLGESKGTAGRNTKVETKASLQGLAVSAVVTVGRDAPTQAEVAKVRTIRNILINKSTFSSAWDHAIYGKGPEPTEWPPEWSTPFAPPLPIIQDETYPLNPSQAQAVTAMLDTSNKNHLILVQGPPGTGKTSVIARFVLSAIQGGRKGIWLVAQSNVAVKNIAEKLLAIGFNDWRLLVSNDFHEGWHEHLYRSLGPNVILSKVFNPTNIRKQMQGCQVVLCTLSMLSHFKLPLFTSTARLSTLIIDEASQIGLGDYLSVLDKQATHLRKMVFIGDDKQLPPFGDEEMRSIFEVDQLRPNALFLDTQYRMPPQIGDFISTTVYDGLLKSNPLHPISSNIPAVHFVDIPDGKGVTPPEGGTSFINVKEAETIVKIATKFQEENRKFRIITPYDSQRTLVEATLKEAELDWGNKVFNVDSFQGNEEDYIIISIVRHMGLGFLQDRRRTNVMLSRCKKGMYICTSQRYLKEGGKDSMVAEMAQEFGEEAWLSVKDIEGGNF